MAKAKAKPHYTKTKDGIVLDIDAVTDAMFEALKRGNEEEEEDAKKPPFYGPGEGIIEVVSDDHMGELPSTLGTWAKRIAENRK